MLRSIGGRGVSVAGTGDAASGLLLVSGATGATRATPAFGADDGATASFVYAGNVKSNRYSGPSGLNCTFADIWAGSAAASTRASR